MTWPLSQDYNEAIQNPRTSFSDAELRQGQVVTNALGIPQPCSGNFADVYAVECAASKTKWAVKCFTRQVSGLSERYSEISKYLRLAKLPFTVEFQYLEQGIRVRGQWYPILKMQWVEGFVLNAFVRDNLDKKPILQALGQIWLRMARRLRESYIAHCDLQHGNVMFVPGSSAHSLAIKLIDYDGMCVPSLIGTKSGEVGHPAYQHPERMRTGAYNQEVDRFSLLSIAAALRCLAVGGRSLWQRYDTGDNLLFRQSDLQSPADSPLFRELLTIDDAQARMLVQELVRACQGPLDDVPLLTDLLPEEKAASKATATVAKQPAAAAAAPAAADVAWDFAAGKKAEADRKRTSGMWRWGLVGGGAAAALLVAGFGIGLALRQSPETPKNDTRIAQKKPEKPAPPPTKTPEDVVVTKDVEAPPNKPEPSPAKVEPVKVVKADGPVDDEWLKAVAALPAAGQVDAVAKKLQRLNPGFDGQVKHRIEGGVVTQLDFFMVDVADLSPVRALTGLRILRCLDNPVQGRLTDLSPLKGVNLTVLDMRQNQGLGPIAVCKGMPLTKLACDNTNITDLTPLKDMKLREFSCANAKIADLSPLKDMKLESLGIWGTQVADLSPLKNMKLRWLSCKNSRVTDLSPLKDMPLKELWCNFKPERDAVLLRSLKTLEQIDDKPAAAFWAEVKLPSEPTVKPAEPVVAKPTPKPVEDKPILPNDDAIDAAVKDVQNEFKEEYARKTSKANQELAAKLLAEGRKSKDEGAKRFALFREARDLAARGAAPALSVEAAQELATAYSLDPVKTKVAALEAAGKAVDAAPIAKAYLKEAHPLLKDALENDQYDAVAPIVSPTRRSLQFANDAEQKRTLGPLLDQIEYLRKQYNAIKADVRTLEEKPDDPDANLAVGRFLCFHKKDWDKGLPLLGKGRDKAVANAAEKDRAQPKQAAAQVVVGDAWYNLAVKAQADVRPTLQKRACSWYVRALPELNGADKTRVEKCVLEISKSFPELRTAWAGLDISQAVVVGDAYLRLPRGRTLAIKKPIGGEVEIEVVCRTAKQMHHFEILQEGTAIAHWELKTGTLWFSRNRVGNKGGNGSGSAFEFTPDRWYTFTCQLTDEAMKGTLDGRPRFNDRVRATPAKPQLFAIRPLNETMEIRSFTVKPLAP